jgi:cytoskeleton protein RodZ
MAEPGRDVSLGSYLRALREARKTSLEEMAQVTRVSVRQLDALESDDLADLPSAVFVKGFIRAYCQVLRESPDEALAKFRAMRGTEPRVERPLSSTRPAPSSWSGSPVFVSLVLLLLFGSGLLALNLGFSRGSKSAAVAPGAPMVSVEPAATAPSPVPGDHSPRTAVQRLVVSVVETTWLRVQADDGKSIEELLRPGATREWTARRRFLVTVGNAGGIELTLNGRRLPPLGGRGVVIRGLELPRAAEVPAS